MSGDVGKSFLDLYEINAFIIIYECNVVLLCY